MSWPTRSIQSLLDDGSIVDHIDGNHGELYPTSDEFVSAGIPYLSANCIIGGVVDLAKAKYLTREKADSLRKGKARAGDVLFAHNATVGPVAKLIGIPEAILSTTLTLFRTDAKKLSEDFLMQSMSSYIFRKQYEKVMGQSTRNQVPITAQRLFAISLPPLPEQKKIAEILSCWDRGIEEVDSVLRSIFRLKSELLRRLIYSKNIPSARKLSISESCDILDNKRKPLNQEQRAVMQGSYPYYGANGQVDSINEFIFDEPLVLLAEDGGNFSEYRTRPIAYQIRGKSWVNNHAHVLRARSNLVSQDFLFYSLVHRDITPVLNGGTRAKLNKSELESITLDVPTRSVQDNITNLLNSITLAGARYGEIRANLWKQKQGLMQQLLTGKVRVKA